MVCITQEKPKDKTEEKVWEILRKSLLRPDGIKIYLGVFCKKKINGFETIKGDLQSINLHMSNGMCGFNVRLEGGSCRSYQTATIQCKKAFLEWVENFNLTSAAKEPEIRIGSTARFDCPCG